MILVGILGILLVFTGLWPRRRGDTPYCRKCKYNLTGITSNRCPECGNATGKRGVVVGIRKRKPIRGILGLLLLCPLIGIIYDEAIVFDWFAHQPTSWLIWELESADELLACRASNELYWRFNRRKLSISEQSRFVDAILDWEGTRSSLLDTGGITFTGEVVGSSIKFITCYDRKFLAETYREGLMSDSQIDEYFRQIRESKLINVTAILEVPSGAERTQSKLIDLLLDFQGRLSGEHYLSPDCMQHYIDYLGKCQLAELMSNAQEARFFNQLVLYEFDITSEIVSGDTFTFELARHLRIPSDPWYIDIGNGVFVIGNQEFELDQYTVEPYTYWRTTIFRHRLPCNLPAGKHELVLEVPLATYLGEVADESSTLFVDNRKIRVSQEIVVSKKTPDL